MVFITLCVPWKYIENTIEMSQCDELCDGLNVFYEIHMEEYIGHCNYYTYIYKPEYSVDTFVQIVLQYYYNFSILHFLSLK